MPRYALAPPPRGCARATRPRRRSKPRHRRHHQRRAAPRSRDPVDMKCVADAEAESGRQPRGARNKRERLDPSSP
eukprot:99675-Alexandrium_andersonii.AAC.1